MPTHRLLFVDDEQSLRVTLPPILELHGYEVVSVGTVAEALAAIQAQPFDVLLSDLNIGEPGDGFTVVSAMRRTQPQAVTIIITGYPAFESALRAIRSQVDDYVVKPANVETLVQVIQEKLVHRTPRETCPVRRVAEMLAENVDAILEEWLKRAKADPQLAAIRLTDEERINHLPIVLEEAVTRAGAPDGERADASEASRIHGQVRRRQGYTVPMMLEERRLLAVVIGETVQANLLGIDISNLIHDMLAVNNTLDQQFRVAVEAFLAESERKSDVA